MAILALLTGRLSDINEIPDTVVSFFTVHVLYSLGSPNEKRGLQQTKKKREKENHERLIILNIY